jgi:hypothetical protein
MHFPFMKMVYVSFFECFFAVLNPTEEPRIDWSEGFGGCQHYLFTHL